jgi:type II restriction enzyme
LCKLSEDSKAWADMPDDDTDIELNLRGLAWAKGAKQGRIDPAGADEHWKTAHTALNRIREAFAKKKLKPYTFFHRGSNRGQDGK